MGIKNFPWKIIWYVLGAIGGIGGIVTIVIYFKETINFLGNFIGLLFRATISPVGRDVVLFLLLLILIMIVIIFRKQKISPVSKEEGSLANDFKNHREGYKKFVEETDKNIRQLRQDLSGIYDKAKKYEEIDTSPRLISILEALGAKSNGTMTKKDLFFHYLSLFGAISITGSRSAMLPFNMNISWLETNGYIFRDIPKDDNEEIVGITPKGFEYLRLAKIKITEEKKKE